MELKLEDMIKNKDSLPLPKKYVNALQDIYDLSLNYPDDVKDLRVNTYRPQHGRFNLRFTWDNNEWDNAEDVHIGYDVPSEIFVDWYKEALMEYSRYDHKELLNLFKEKFEKKK